MQRCVVFLALAWALTLSLTLAPASAQVQRNFPANALRGAMQITQPPQLLLNGGEARLAAGARIRDENNFLIMSGVLTQRRVLVHYTLDTTGQLLDVWILTPAEAAMQPWPRNLAEVRAWIFDPIGQSWSRP